VRRRADVLFSRQRVAVFIDGCLWHSCPDHCRPPRTNADYWHAKLARNQARDADTNRRLTELGWTVLRIWEHENAGDAAKRVATLVAARSDRQRQGKGS
jgi:DNA mismatch endonuclease (patch repair protein)